MVADPKEDIAFILAVLCVGCVLTTFVTGLGLFVIMAGLFGVSAAALVMFK